MSETNIHAVQLLMRKLTFVMYKIFVDSFNNLLIIGGHKVIVIDPLLSI